MGSLEEKVARCPPDHVIFVRGTIVRRVKIDSFDRWLARMRREMPRIYASALAQIESIEDADESAGCPREGLVFQDEDDRRRWVIDVTGGRVRVSITQGLLS